MAPSTNAVTSTWVGVVPVHRAALAVTGNPGPGPRIVAGVVREITAVRDQQVG